MKDLRKPHLRSLTPYVPGKSVNATRSEFGLTGRVVKLASNENPLGSSPRAIEAMRQALSASCLYPDTAAFLEKVAEKFHVSVDNVLAGAGSTELIELIGCAFLGPDDVVVTSEKTFILYKSVAQKAGAKLRCAPMREGYRYDLSVIANLIDDHTKVVFLANPTNPTGTWFSRHEFDLFMRNVPRNVLVVYDAAYDEFSTASDLPDPMDYFREDHRIMILRTFSKAYGLAGLRVGFALAPVEVVNWLEMMRVPFSLNAVALAGAIAALDDVEYVAHTREHNTQELAFLRNELSAFPVCIPPSQGNFLLLDTDFDATYLFTELQKRGIIIRPMGPCGLPNAIRVSVGRREDNEVFLTSFRDVLAQRHCHRRINDLFRERDWKQNSESCSRGI